MSAGITGARAESAIAHAPRHRESRGQARMSASSRMKIIIPLVSAMSLLALSAQAQEARPPRDSAQPPGPGAPQQNMRSGSPQQAVRPAPQPGGPAHAGPGPGADPRGAGGPPPGRYMARGPAAARDWGG